MNEENIFMLNIKLEILGTFRIFKGGEIAFVHPPIWPGGGTSAIFCYNVATHMCELVIALNLEQSNDEFLTNTWVGKGKKKLDVARSNINYTWKNI